MNSAQFGLMLLSLSVMSNVAAQVFKCEGESGTVYQQMPCDDDQPTVAESPDAAPETKSESNPVVGDPEAWIRSHAVDGRTACSYAVEQLAQHKHRWTAGMFGDRFPIIRVHDKHTGTIAFVGDNIEFMNGFGAWIPHQYACIYSPSTGKAQAHAE